VTIDDQGRRAAQGLRRVAAPPPGDPVDRFERFRARKYRSQRIGVIALVIVIAVPSGVFAMRALTPRRTAVSTPDRPSGLIVYGDWHQALQRADWYTVRPDGSGVTDLHVRASCAAWWPDGSKIWITNDAARSPGHPLRPATIAPDGSGLRPLDATPNPDLNLGCGDVSPDGSRMVLEGFNDRKKSVNGIYTVRAYDGGDLVRLTDGLDGYPQYAPDGSKVVFFRMRPGVVPDGAGALFVVNVDGTGLRRITPWGDAFLQQSWSPDGVWIAFQKPYGQLFLVHPDGTDLHVVPVALPAGMGVRQPAWSPDGGWIVFGAEQGSDADLFMVRSDGTNLTRITATTDLVESGPDWAPASAPGSAPA
jgi:Tol biopolymer transport system component